MKILVSLTTFQESRVAEQLPLGSALMKSIHIISGSSIGQHFPVFQEISSLSVCLPVNELQCRLDGLFRVQACQTSVDEVIEHIHYY